MRGKSTKQNVMEEVDGSNQNKNKTNTTLTDLLV
jgi:hypothetical protein